MIFFQYFLVCDRLYLKYDCLDLAIFFCCTKSFTFNQHDIKLNNSLKNYIREKKDNNDIIKNMKKKDKQKQLKKLRSEKKNNKKIYSRREK